MVTKRSIPSDVIPCQRGSFKYSARGNLIAFTSRPKILEIRVAISFQVMALSVLHNW
jgi:hypothetical protein